MPIINWIYIIEYVESLWTIIHSSKEISFHFAFVVLMKLNIHKMFFNLKVQKYLFIKIYIFWINYSLTSYYFDHCKLCFY